MIMMMRMMVMTMMIMMMIVMMMMIPNIAFSIANVCIPENDDDKRG